MLNLKINAYPCFKGSNSNQQNNVVDTSKQQIPIDAQGATNTTPKSERDEYHEVLDSYCWPPRPESKRSESHEVLDSYCWSPKPDKDEYHEVLDSYCWP